MQAQHRSGRFPAPSLPFALLCVLMAALWMAGGASRADALGQVVVRGVAWLLLIVGILFGERPAIAGAKPILFLLTAALLLALVQMVPLPPAIWQAFPGRDGLVEAAAVSGQGQPWRPWSIVPGATFNAAASLVIPFATLLFVAGLEDGEREWLPGLILGLILASAVQGLLQFSGASFNNPFINEVPGELSGIFANRNHLALFLAFGCLLAPVWAFWDGRRPRWRAPTAFGIALLLALTIVAIGSRAGLGLGILALALGLLLTWRNIRKEFERAPRWVFPAFIAAVVGTIGLFVFISIAADRAEAIDRVFALDPGQDMRRRGLPTVLTMVQTYFPLGAGLGSFDAIFRVHEPFALLKPTYFNHAHNDLLEIVGDAGLAGLLLLLGALGWWAWASVRAWRAGSGMRHVPPKLGSAMLLLIIVASAFDYPARTPMMMAMIVIAAVWLSPRPAASGGSALPKSAQHL